MARVGDIIQLGKWPREPEGQPEPLAWRVLETYPDGTLLAITRDVIESRSFHDKKTNITWIDSDLRYWLNEVFYATAFSDNDRRHIAVTYRTTPDNRTYRTSGGADTEDRVFCLSSEEALRCFAGDDARKAAGTSYALRIQNASPSSWWWLRSSGGHQFTIAAVAEAGYVDVNGFHATLDMIGVRPAVILRSVPLQTPLGTPSGRALSETFSRPERLAPSRAFDNAGDALRYGQADIATKLLSRSHLTPAMAELALSGGYPSFTCAKRMLLGGQFGEVDRVYLCHAAVRMRATQLALMFLQRSNYGADWLIRSLRSAVETGNLELTKALCKQGAPTDGFAGAYLRDGVSDKVAICVIAADRQSSYNRWCTVSKLDKATQYFLRSCIDAGELQRVARLDGLLTLLAGRGWEKELRQVVEKGGVTYTPADFMEAIEAAKAGKHSRVVAYLLEHYTPPVEYHAVEEL